MIITQPAAAESCAEEGCSTQPWLQGGQEAPAQDSHAVHIPLLAAAYSLPRLSSSAGIKLLRGGVTQHWPEPRATAGTASGRQHLISTLGLLLCSYRLRP